MERSFHVLGYIGAAALFKRAAMQYTVHHPNVICMPMRMMYNICRTYALGATNRGDIRTHVRGHSPERKKKNIYIVKLQTVNKKES